MGAPNIDSFKPASHSIIKVADFDSPKALAEYLTILDNNEGKHYKFLFHEILVMY